MLNTRLCTLYPLDSIVAILNSYIAQNFDFGTAYAYLCQYWNDILIIEDTLHTQELGDREMRRNVLADGMISQRAVSPRRLWDLYANRVVPYWVASFTVLQRPWAISHAWVDEKDRIDVMTPVGGYEWPMPMPKDANLDLIRIEMLNLGAEYMWLDVLCLRQEGGKNEQLRKDEWKLDVPTIGWVYKQALDRVVCYFNRLGRPLHLTQGYFEDDRCWFRRAWTLQEIPYCPIIGGETGKDVMDKQVQRQFSEQLASLQKMRESASILELMSEMKHRVSTKPLDKVAGLVYLLQTGSIPIYDAEKSAADAWEVLVDAIAPWYQAQLLFLYPEPGNRNKYWQPSWEQLMTDIAIAPDSTVCTAGFCQTSNILADGYVGYNIVSGNVGGLGEVSNQLMPRHGELVFNDASGAPRKVKIIADHAFPVPDGSYTLLRYHSNGIDSNLDHWVAGKIRQDGRFEKLLVFRSAGDEKLDLYRRLHNQLVEMLLC
ncbi:hypothetical protein EDD18DRAFT_1083165 [Armillaria luteobubalina]|uniref:Heterokaryon incompatibility domain-containing protein n=1 Tax=Armillaria luteobubalina TaxID=153913 RepID=A0AA39UDU0_9AGAR|nr:hypothetical protein EDD18DRAFT_1083165 [Armillaria luteobubalina]